MSTQTPSSLGVSADGTRLTLAIPGLVGANVTASVGDVLDITVDAQTDGYDDDGDPDTAARTGLRCMFAAAADGEVTLWLEEPVYDGDTVTVTAAEGAITDGQTDLAALADEPVDNTANELPLPEPVCILAVPPWRLHREPFYVDVYAVGPACKGFRAQGGIAAVGVAVTDADTNSVAKWATAMSAFPASSTNAAYANKVLFRVGPFDPRPDGDWGAGGAADGVATIEATAYPKVGEPGDAETLPCFLDAGESLVVAHAVVSPAGNNSTGQAALGDGGWSTGQNALADAARAAPFADPHRAARACQSLVQAETGTARCSFCVVYLAAGDHQLGVVATPNLLADRGPLILASLPELAFGAARLTGSANSDAMRVLSLQIDRLDCPISTGLLRNSTSPPTGGFQSSSRWLVFSGSHLRGPGAAAQQSIQKFNGWQRVFVFGSRFSDVWDLSLSSSVVDCTIERLAQDAHFGASHALWCNNRYRQILGDTVPEGGWAGPPHADLVQFNASASRENIAFHQCVIEDATKFQGPLYLDAGSNAANAPTVRRLAVTLCTYPDDRTDARGQLRGFGFDGLYYYANSVDDGLNIQNNNGNLRLDSAFVCDNVLARVSAAAMGARPLQPAGWVNNHIASANAAVPPTFDQDGGGLFTDLFVDFDGGDRTPAPAGPLVDRVAEPIFPFDASGQPVPTDGSAAIGALQIPADPSAADPLPIVIAETDATGTATLIVFGRSLETAADEPAPPAGFAFSTGQAITGVSILAPTLLRLTHAVIGSHQSPTLSVTNCPLVAADGGTVADDADLSVYVNASTADIVRPTILSGSVPAGGDRVRLQADEPLQVADPPFGQASAFAVTASGGALTLELIEIDDDALVLAPSRTILDGETLSVTIDGDASNIADLAGNALNDATDLAITNESTQTATPTDTTPPTFKSGLVSTTGTLVQLFHSELLDLGDPASLAGYTITAGGVPRTITGVQAPSLPATSAPVAVVDPPIYRFQAVTVEYDATLGDVQDLAGNALESFGPVSISSMSMVPEPDTEAAVAISAAVQPSGTSTRVFFDKPLNPATASAAGFTLGGQPVLAASASGSVLTLTHNPVQHDDPDPQVAYTPGALAGVNGAPVEAFSLTAENQSILGLAPAPFPMGIRRAGSGLEIRWSRPCIFGADYDDGVFSLDAPDAQGPVPSAVVYVSGEGSDRWRYTMLDAPGGAPVAPLPSDPIRLAFLASEASS